MATLTGADRKAYYDRIGALNLAPLWEYRNPSTPRTPAVPVHWRWDDVRPHLIESGDIISKAEAHRRVLVLENPGLRGAQAATRTLYAGLQLIRPGEVAPNHRHTQSALRFVLEGEGAYTAVAGARAEMRPGDFVVTPSWAWHDHGNEGTGPVIWLDVLDSPTVAFLGTEFRENANETRQGANAKALPALHHPYAQAHAALTGPCDPCHGIRRDYRDPATGSLPFPTIGTFLQLLPKGFSGLPYRSTDSVIYAVAEGHGRTIVGDATFSWGPRDVFVVPSWTWHAHEAEEDAVLFGASDRPLHQKLNLWREERGDA
jgi:gentisate 1,2-dioxygenase